RPYAWGSTSALQTFSGFGTTGSPLAELWYGAHPAGPTKVPDGRTLSEFIAEDPQRSLGPAVAKAFDGQLPFLVKLLAPAQTVSLQVHPSADRAAECFAAQQDTPAVERTFVDANHKPEMVYALTDF